MRPKTGLDDVERRKILPLPGLEVQPRSQWPHRLRYPQAFLHRLVPTFIMSHTVRQVSRSVDTSWNNSYMFQLHCRLTDSLLMLLRNVHAACFKLVSFLALLLDREDGGEMFL
jgi:hypothetical protein